MRIVFDAYWWGKGPSSLRHVLRETVLAWHTHFPQDELVLVTRRKHRHLVEPQVADAMEVVSTTVWPQALSAVLVVPRHARRHHADAILTQNFSGRYRGVSTVFLHDVLFVTNPEWFTYVERAYFSLMPRTAARADVVFTSSQAEARRISDHTTARQVQPVGLGLSKELVDDPEVTPVPGLSSGRYLLTVGRLNARKNLGRTLLGALQSGVVSPDMPVVVVGYSDGKSEEYPAPVARAIATGAIRFTGFVSEAELRWLYEHTALFLFLSLGEGYGMPPIEALHYGARVLASDIPVLRETLGDRASFVAPHDVEAIASAIRPLLQNAPSDNPQPDARWRYEHSWERVVRAMRSHLERVVLERAGTRPNELSSARRQR